MFRVLTCNYAGRYLLGVAPDLDAAKAMVPGEIHYMVEDSDNPQCFDLINDRGEAFAIEPIVEVGND